MDAEEKDLILYRMIQVTSATALFRLCEKMAEKTGVNAVALKRSLVEISKELENDKPRNHKIN